MGNGVQLAMGNWLHKGELNKLNILKIMKTRIVLPEKKVTKTGLEKSSLGLELKISV